MYVRTLNTTYQIARSTVDPAVYSLRRLSGTDSPYHPLALGCWTTLTNTEPIHVGRPIRGYSTADGRLLTTSRVVHIGPAA